MDVLKPLPDGRESAARRMSMSCHLGGLTVRAGAGPRSDVIVDSLPDEARCHQMLRSSDAKVREIMKLTEGLVSVPP